MDPPDFRVSKFIQSTFNFLEDVDITAQEEASQTNDKTDQSHDCNNTKNQEVTTSMATVNHKHSELSDKATLIASNGGLLRNKDPVKVDNDCTDTVSLLDAHNLSDERGSEIATVDKGLSDGNCDICEINQATGSEQPERDTNRTTFRPSVFIRNTFDFLENEQDEEQFVENDTDTERTDIVPRKNQKQNGGLDHNDNKSTVAGTQQEQLCDISDTANQDNLHKNIDISSNVEKCEDCDNQISSDSDKDINDNMTKKKPKFLCVSNKLGDITEETEANPVEFNDEVVMRSKQKPVEAEDEAPEDVQPVVMRDKGTNRSISQASEADESDSDEEDGNVFVFVDFVHKFALIKNFHLDLDLLHFVLSVRRVVKAAYHTLDHLFCRILP